jgi:hypothetical protein
MNTVEFFSTTLQTTNRLCPELVCSDFPYVVPECGYKGAKEAISHVAGKIDILSPDLEWILGKTVRQLFQGAWVNP